MEFIFHEKQSGSLCAQHCLNALLQGAYFTVFDLAEIAKSLDESERRHMAEAGSNTNEYQAFLQQPSSNFDDSGFFSIQVLVDALKVWNVELLPLTSSDEFCRRAREEPTQQEAFICNFREHWLTIRKIGLQWFNLNSLIPSPEVISDTYLTLFLKQLQFEGYSIFVVRGALPSCEADEILKLCPVDSTHRAIRPVNHSNSNNIIYDNDPELKWALESSRQMYDDADTSLKEALRKSAEGGTMFPMSSSNDYDNDPEFKWALENSRQISGADDALKGVLRKNAAGATPPVAVRLPPVQTTPVPTPVLTHSVEQLSLEELRLRRLKALQKKE